ncbi:unnamed protein product, partial [Mesorhabditis belari]|uniref:Uncharacterized protein n=1 Tax=Mesorhabditis belari TaxID=2138241 RepID=A0AAF3FMM4_9BILA
MATEFDLVKQDLARERGERQRLSLENSQLKQQLAALRKDKTEVVEPETDIRIQFIEKDLLIHRLQEEIQNRGSTKACPEVVIPRRIEVEDNCDIEMLNLEMPDDCLPALIAVS